jgi:DNA-binding NarL/FixJ family response regulator
VSEYTIERQREFPERVCEGLTRQVVSAERVRVAVHAGDAVVRVGLLSFLRQDRRVAGIDTTARTEEANVVVVAVETADDSALQILQCLRAHSDIHFLLIVKRQWRIEISAALDCGVRAMLWHSDFSPEEFTSRILSAARAGASPHPPGSDLRNQVRQHHHEVSTPTDLPPSEATNRERNVLRLLAEGYELAEIAAELCYSERTIKYVLHRVMKRWGLRNRAHAVSYAIRTGLI